MDTLIKTKASGVSSAHQALRVPRDAILNDYRLACLSRQVGVVGRREVLSGNAKFGIFGDGKELAQLALAHAFRPGDFRSGYYRDQTLAFALGMSSPRQFFAQLYGHTDASAEPATAGRLMGAHFASQLLDEHGNWLPQHDQFNTSADISPTAGQMPRLVGLAYASRLYREVDALHAMRTFSSGGNEVAFGTIGNASCAEGLFWEAINAIGVLRVPAVIAVWDDDYGISVPNALQLAKVDLSLQLAGFQYDPACDRGFNLFKVRGWEYPELLRVFAQATQAARHQHIPAIVHVTEMTQPSGHSTSGSHERYKSRERLQWEQAFDPLRKMREWLLGEALATSDDLDALEREARSEAEAARLAAWDAMRAPLCAEANALADLIDAATSDPESQQRANDLRAAQAPLRREMLAAQRSVVACLDATAPGRAPLVAWRSAEMTRGRQRYSSHLTSESAESALRVPVVSPSYPAEPAQVRGFELLRANFDACLARDARVCLLGEDVGQLGDVNQGTTGLQAKYGALRVSDTGIREATIVGQAIGMALRGLRPIAEIQYIDYIYYALTTLSDDLACLHWRTAGKQKAPAIIRTRGHRLEGVWHSGSPMGTLIHALRGMWIAVPRDMTRAAGFYNTLLRGDDPALIVEPLNGYRLYEALPDNIGEFTMALGMPEILRSGEDATLVTYGACCRIALDAAEHLARYGISVEVIDVQTLLPFDLTGTIGASLAKTGRIAFLDEDVPGGATAYMLQQVLEVQCGYWRLDSQPVTITAQPHRPAYGSDGDYFSKPNADDVFDAIYALILEAEPGRN